MRRILIIILLIALGTVFDANSQVTAAVPTIYAEIVSQATSGRFSSVTILYLDLQIRTRTTVTPQSLARIGCHIGLVSDSAKWPHLIAILRAESPRDAGNTSGEVRWGIIFHDSGGARQAIYFGAYYGPSSDKMPLFGYVNAHRVHFSPKLPKEMSAFIRGLNCKGRILARPPQN
jgi:hypothetical protein